MSDLRDAILDAKYIDMISAADFIARDCDLPEVDANGNLMPQATDIAAALFRWAAGAEAAPVRGPAAHAASMQAAEDAEYDENGDPIMDADDAARMEAERMATAAGEAKETR